jgi:ribosomal protein S27E
MGYLKEKAAYLRGLTEGLALDDTTKDGKVLFNIIDLLDEMVDSIEENEAAIAELDDGIAELSDDLDELLSEFEDEDFDEEDDEDDAYDEDFLEIECPQCNEMIYFDQSMLESENPLICPNCGRTLVPKGLEEEE